MYPKSNGRARSCVLKMGQGDHQPQSLQGLAGPVKPGGGIHIPYEVGREGPSVS